MTSLTTAHLPPPNFGPRRGVGDLQREWPQYVSGFTGIGVILLAAIAYSIEVSLSPRAGNAFATTSFLALNVIAWSAGAFLRKQDSQSLPGFMLILLGDSLFPLNLFAPLVLAVPGFRGHMALSATAVLLIGLAYHLANYRNRTSARFVLPFYPYFYAVTSTMVLVLLTQTAGLSWQTVAWLVVIFATAFHELSRRQRPEPPTHFAIASAILLALSICTAVVAFRDRKLLVLLSMAVISFVAIHGAIARHQKGEDATQFFGFVSWASITALATATLFYFHSPLWLYVVATATWILVLGGVPLSASTRWAEPFQESAWWLGLLLATVLLLALMPASLPTVLRNVPLTPAAHAPDGIRIVALIEVGFSMLVASSFRRRFPAIAFNMTSFVINTALLRFSTYAAPMVLLLALTGLWPLLRGPQPAMVFAPLALGTLLLLVAPSLERLYAVEALDVAGIAALVLAAFNAFSSPDLSGFVLAAGAVILLGRWMRGSGAWAYAGFLLLGTAAAFLITPLLPLPLKGLNFVVAGCVLFLIVVALPRARQSLVLLAVTEIWAIGFIVAGLTFQTTGSRTSVPVLLLAVIASTGSSLWLERRTLRETGSDWVSLTVHAGYWTAHAGAFLVWRSLTRNLGLWQGESLRLALWAWVLFGVWKVLPEVRRNPIFRKTVAYLSGACAILSLLASLPPTLNTGGVIISTLAIAALLLEVPNRETKAWRPLHFIGFFFMVASAVIAITLGEVTALIATLGVSAALSLSQSLRQQSLFGHSSFLITLTVAAVQVMDAFRGWHTVPLALLVAVFLVVHQLLERIEQRASFKGELTLLCTLIVTVSVIVMEVSSGRFGVTSLALLFGSVMMARLPLAHGAHHGVNEVQRMLQFALVVAGELSGVLFGVAMVRMAGVSVAGQLFALSVAAWIVGTLLLRLPARSFTARATVVVLHVILGSLYLCVALAWNGSGSGSNLLFLACASGAGVYLMWWSSRRVALAEHLAAIGLVEAIFLWGLSQRIPWPEFYLSTVAIYLCTQIIPRREKRSTSTPHFLTNRVVPVLVVLLGSSFPLFELLRTRGQVSAVFLGIMSVLIIHVLLTAGNRSLLLAATCLQLVIGTLFCVLFVHTDVRLNLLMAAEGLLIIIDLGSIRNRREPVPGALQERSA